MNDRLLKTQTSAPWFQCTAGCGFATPDPTGICDLCRGDGKKLRDGSIADRDPMPKRVDLFGPATPWRDLAAVGQASLERSQAVRELLAADCAPSPSAPVLREVDAAEPVLREACGRCHEPIILGSGGWRVDVNGRAFFQDHYCADGLSKHSPFALPDLPPSRWQRFESWCFDHPAAVLAMGGVVLVVITVLGGILNGRV